MTLTQYIHWRKDARKLDKSIMSIGTDGDSPPSLAKICIDSDEDAMHTLLPQTKEQLPTLERLLRIDEDVGNEDSEFKIDDAASHALNIDHQTDCTRSEVRPHSVERRDGDGLDGAHNAEDFLETVVFIDSTWFQVHRILTDERLDG